MFDLAHLKGAGDETIKFLVTMISILNPIGVIPIFLTLTQNKGIDRIRMIARTSSITVMITIFCSLVLGQRILNFFGITIASFTIGGGILIFSMAYSMIQARQHDAKMNEDEIDSIDQSREIGIVPLAIPLLSGPGVISTSIIHARGFTTPLHWAGALLVVLIIGVVVWLILSRSRAIGEKLGSLGLNVMTRVMGLILMAISIEMILGGLKEIMPILKASFQ